MKNLGQLMKQAQQAQAKMAELQAALDQAEVTGQSGGGMVTITTSAKGDPKKVKIDPKLVDPNDVQMLEDLITAAFNDARAKADQVANAEMQRIQSGMGLPPGLNIPGFN